MTFKTGDIVQLGRPDLVSFVPAEVQTADYGEVTLCICIGPTEWVNVAWRTSDGVVPLWMRCVEIQLSSLQLCAEELCASK